jgi:hypothetical protein
MNLMAVGMGLGIVQTSRQSVGSKTIVSSNLPGPKLATHLVLGWRPDRRSVQLKNFIKLIGTLTGDLREAARG